MFFVFYLSWSSLDTYAIPDPQSFLHVCGEIFPQSLRVISICLEFHPLRLSLGSEINS